MEDGISWVWIGSGDILAGGKGREKLNDGRIDRCVGLRTALPVAYFFSVATMAPVLWALFNAPLPRTTVSRCDEPPPVLLPILVTVSQSSMVVGCWL